MRREEQYNSWKTNVLSIKLRTAGTNYKVTREDFLTQETFPSLVLSVFSEPSDIDFLDFRRQYPLSFYTRIIIIFNLKFYTDGQCKHVYFRLKACRRRFSITARVCVWMGLEKNERYTRKTITKRDAHLKEHRIEKGYYNNYCRSVLDASFWNALFWSGKKNTEIWSKYCVYAFSETKYIPV